MILAVVSVCPWLFDTFVCVFSLVLNFGNMWPLCFHNQQLLTSQEDLSKASNLSSSYGHQPLPRSILVRLRLREGLKRPDSDSATASNATVSAAVAVVEEVQSATRDDVPFKSLLPQMFEVLLYSPGPLRSQMAPHCLHVCSYPKFRI